MRMEQNYDAEKVSDLYGNHVSVGWNPRGCMKGYTLVRRIYGPYRVKYPMVRKGWLAWAQAGFPADEDGRPKAKYFQRGEDSWERVTWEKATNLIAKALLHVA